MDLDTYLARKDDAGLLVASYNQHTEQLVFERPARLIVNPRRRQRMVEFSSRAEQLGTWHPDAAHPYGAAHSADAAVSLLVTPEHDMFVQHGAVVVGADGQRRPVWSSTKRGDVVDPPRKLTAATLMTGDARGSYDAIRLVASASAGQTTAAEAAAPYVAALGLASADAVTAFLEVYGFWLGAGANDDGRGACVPTAVCFSVHTHATLDWLTGALTAAGLVVSVDFATHSTPLAVHVTNARWVHLFLANRKSLAHDQKPLGAGSDCADRDAFVVVSSAAREPATHYFMPETVSRATDAAEVPRVFADWVWHAAPCTLRTILRGVQLAAADVAVAAVADDAEEASTVCTA